MGEPPRDHEKLGWLRLLRTSGFRRLLAVRFAAQWGDGVFQAALGGAVLFLIGRIMLGMLVYTHPVWRTSTALGLLLAASPCLVRLPPMVVGLVTAVALVAVVLVFFYLPGRRLRAERQRQEEEREERRRAQQERERLGARPDGEVPGGPSVPG